MVFPTFTAGHRAWAWVTGGAGLGLGLAVWLDTLRGRSFGRSLVARLGRAVGMLLALYALLWILQNWVLDWLEHFPYNIAGGT